MNVETVCVLIAIAIILIMLFVILILRAKLQESEKKLKYEREYTRGLLNELNKVKAESQIRQEEKKDADEKIDELHNGDSVSNAINRLSKH